MKEMIFRSASFMAKAIKAREVSSLEVVAACIQQMKLVNPKLHAVVQTCEDYALQSAVKADEALANGQVLGPLHGVPMTIKDSLDTEGVITTWGLKEKRAHIPRINATVVERLRNAGAILIGKTNTPELTLSFETDNPIYGKTYNPYDLSKSPGGSSGGAAAIIAAGGSPFDIGSDTGGSIRLPAHFCGIAGLKPTAGRVPRTGHAIHGCMGALDKITQLGPMARYVEDLTMIMPIISGVDWRDPAVVPMPWCDPEEVNLQDLRIAYYSDNGLMVPSTDIQNVVKAVAQHLSDSGCILEENRPHEIEKSYELFMRLLNMDDGAWKKRLYNDAGRSDPTFLRGAYSKMQSGELTRFLEEWDYFHSKALSFMESYDAIICPVYPYTAFNHGTWRDKDNHKGFSYTMAYNLTGWPSAVVRAATSREGMPIGVQVVTSPWREDIALAITRSIEESFGGWSKPALL